MSEEIAGTNQSTSEGDKTGLAQNELEAQKQGWKPKEEFKGKPEDWVGADEFLRRGKEWAPLVSAQNRELKETLQDMRKLLRDQMDMNYRKQNESRQQYDQRIVELQQYIQQLEQKLAGAITEQDGAAVVAAQRGIKAAETEIQQTQQAIQASRAQQDALAQQWKVAHEWYGKDAEATEWADFYGSRAALRGASPQTILDEIDSGMKTKFPQLYGIDQVSRSAQNSGGSRSVASSGSSGNENSLWDSLSPDEQDIAKKVMKKTNLTRDQYLKSLGLVF